MRLEFSPLAFFRTYAHVVRVERLLHSARDMSEGFESGDGTES